ncbi:MAG: pantoate--beta-alanine ligase [Candidatus Poriferisodalaceae bacterium]|jgi:pantoate--beta-alanine ligase|tara:strand:- start:607 stop:1458 length:852 start_codon:yes stop_codon:yes gene_type:complete
MRLISSIEAVRRETLLMALERKQVGFVPTMGSLHDGHASLLERAAKDNHFVIASVFVNPLQFGDGEDLDSYPRSIEKDKQIAESAGVDILFVPAVKDMYPSEIGTKVVVSKLSQLWEGASREGHFDGVATVVTKLFGIVGPCKAYFGEKDFQQLQIIRQMVVDLNLPVKVVGSPTVREADSLAMSSRNVYLSSEERLAAPILRVALDEGLNLVRRGERDPLVVMALMKQIVETEPLAILDYVAAVNAHNLQIPKILHAEIRLLAAAHIGKTRLLDNDGLTLTE